MEVQILDGRYVDMGKLLRFLNREFGKGNYELESEVGRTPEAGHHNSY